jgi:hypothetical protein
MVLGALVELGSQQVPHNDAFVFYLRALGPLLAYFSIAFAFRGVGLYTLEWELGCPPSALQLIIARLVMVLGYDVCLGFGLSVIAWAHGGTSLLMVTLHWLMPLLLVAGVALVLSQWLSAQRASLLAYSGWLTLLLLLSFPYATTTPGLTTLVLGVGGEVTLSLAGMVLLLIAVWRLVERVPQLLLSPPR